LIGKCILSINLISHLSWFLFLFAVKLRPLALSHTRLITIISLIKKLSSSPKGINDQLMGQSSWQTNDYWSLRWTLWFNTQNGHTVWKFQSASTFPSKGENWHKCQWCRVILDQTCSFKHVVFSTAVSGYSHWWRGGCKDSQGQQ
jgi:hypothetical protein